PPVFFVKQQTPSPLGLRLVPAEMGISERLVPLDLKAFKVTQVLLVLPALLDLKVLKVTQVLHVIQCLSGMKGRDVIKQKQGIKEGGGGG
ncbi:hypothetical protein, partial [Bacillus cereus]|uniref:hypothetical protein n=1 Tax=Bacillus cereus TaxID=1396 RepID=UPI001A7F0D3F